MSYQREPLMNLAPTAAAPQGATPSIDEAQPYGNSAFVEDMMGAAQQGGEEIAMTPWQRAGLLLGGAAAVVNMMGSGAPVPDLSQHWDTYELPKPGLVQRGGGVIQKPW